MHGDGVCMCCVCDLQADLRKYIEDFSEKVKITQTDQQIVCMCVCLRNMCVCVYVCMREHVYVWCNLCVCVYVYCVT